SESATIKSVSKKLLGNYYYELEIVDIEGKVVAQYGYIQLKKIIESAPIDTRLSDLSIVK
ncbi:MAG: hypothetical protein RR086_04960, partial [Clostridia bacterium]